MEKERLVELVRQAQNGDQAAAEELLRAAYPPVSYQCRKMLKNEADAEDVTQEVLMTAYTKLADLQEPAAFWGWLNRLTATRCINAQTRWHKELQFAEDEDGNSVLDSFEDLDDQVVPDRAIDNAETARMIGELVDALPEAQRTCVMLYYFDELSVREIAAMTGVSENTVKSRLNYARKGIKEGVEDYEKQGVKLYGLSPLPFLLFFLRKNASAGFSDVVRNRTVAEILASSAAQGAAAAGAAGAGAVGTATSAAGVAGVAGAAGTTGATVAGAAAGVAKGISVKIVAAMLAGILIGGGASTVFSTIKNKPKSKSLTIQEQIELGQAYFNEGNYEDAIEAFSAAIEISPQRAAAYVSRGNAFVMLGETEENMSAAQSDYQTAMGLDPLNPDAYLGQADVQIRLGDYEAAKEIIELGLEQIEGNNDLQKKLDELDEGNISDSSGNVRCVTVSDENGTLVYRHEFTYGENGKRGSVTSYDASSEQTGHVDYAYDVNGRTLVSYWYLMETGEVGRNDTVRDQEGKAVSSIWYKTTGEFDRQVTYDYDSDGRKIQETYLDYRGYILSYRMFEYDGNGNKIKQTDYSSYGSVTGYTLWFYDESGREIGYSDYDSNGYLLYQRIESYDADYSTP